MHPQTRAARRRAWLVVALLLPLVIYAVLAERASWRPRIFRMAPAGAASRLYSGSGDGSTAMAWDLKRQQWELWSVALEERIKSYPIGLRPSLGMYQVDSGRNYVPTDMLGLGGLARDRQWVIAPHGGQLAVALRDTAGPGTPRGGIALFNMKTKTLQQLGAPNSSYMLLTYSPDGSRLAAMDLQGKARVEGKHFRFENPFDIWDATTGRHLCRFFALASHLAFSPDGSGLATVRQGTRPLSPTAANRTKSEGQTISILQVRDSSSGRVVASWQSAMELNGIAWHPDGRHLVTRTYTPWSSSLLWWDATTGKQTRSGATLISNELGRLVDAIAIAPDGSCIATATIRLRPGATAIRLTPGPNRTPTVSTILLFDGRTGDFQRALHEFEAPLAHLAFRANSRHLIAVGVDGNVADWRLR